MLSLIDLKIFVENHIAEREYLENFFIVASDDELVRAYKDTVNANLLCSFIVIIPSHDVNLQDEDNRKMLNNLYFMVIKKTDSKASENDRFNIFAHTQQEIKALLIKMVDLHHQYTDNCLFKELDLNGIRINPVQDYAGANGFEIEFSTNTEF
ncbi:hypothetical protein M1M27_gp06 [Cellulophaga phage Ingeline_1]|uniref:Uncharacterized protein n=1 Tax=Cellulophaga phage Ingeline_1 TaxID=2745674 RepID=A0A8E5E877_9CAUD|nr:hypothetical protein M1M27_gp06 [Cellulophaga phage Ingeline_1]QQV90034.1 hypothetical protein Ingeline2_45 [Cellulophaga phage Ingeline_2]QQV90084.1 hypothetical protein Ingeline3_45 [Cellulophaga phage Ingeline_3]QQV90134.1 hypothetical protein Ingeline4_45 [Cellulophaga phage Ingeline_4]QQV90183.1 hypothetical protein Ingeline5_44 [Cellulophaga phage Ingeline_5]QQV90233.1 hypothetical protein Ingeline6_45 [Cellulophaga phage Ingeline_6]QQV90283.1 hypothetical protein Ingeline7_45 [Cellu